MNVRQKFFALSGVAGVIMAVVAVVGYFTAANSLRSAVEQEIVAEIGRQSAQADGWLVEKGKYAEGVATQLSKMTAQENAFAQSKSLVAAVAADKEVMDLINVMSDGFAIGLNAGNLTGKADWTKRPWYIECKKANKLIFTDPYKDVNTGGMVISAAMPYARQGAPEGALCEDIKIDTLIAQAKAIKYKGQGKGMIVNPASGIVIASANEEENLKPVTENPYLKERMAEMASNKKGYFTSEAGGESKVIAYDRIPATGWIAVVSAPEDFVFAELRNLRLMYGAVTIVGVALIAAALLFFSNGIVKQVIALTGHINEMANGNLRLEPLAANSTDEFGQMATGFNSMMKNIRELISQMTRSAEQVAASSEELTASSQQAAEAATHVAQTVTEVAGGMDKQLTSVDQAKQNIDNAFVDINAMTEKAATVAENTEQMAGAADHGAELMTNAMDKMNGIEQSVANSAQVVKKLGENSKQIGAIVESISAIADQTNLLALNAAIEAARAGEAGRGFSVVAEEVRKLAEQSQQSAEEIKQRISAIQDDTAEAVVAMEAGTNEVALGTQAIREVGEQFQDITARVSSIKTEMEEINHAVQTVETGMQGIVAAMDNIDEVSRATSEETQTISAAAEEQSASSQEIASASHALADLATELQDATGKFKV